MEIDGNRLQTILFQTFTEFSPSCLGTLLSSFLDLGSSIEKCAGSSPVPGISLILKGISEISPAISPTLLSGIATRFATHPKKWKQTEKNSARRFFNSLQAFRRKQFVPDIST